MPKKLTQEEALKVCLASGWQPDEGWVYSGVRSTVPGRCLNCGIHHYVWFDKVSEKQKKDSEWLACGACANRWKLSDEEVNRRCRERDWLPDSPLTYHGNKSRIAGTCLKCGAWGKGPTANALLKQGACEFCAPNAKFSHSQAYQFCLDWGWKPKEGWEYSSSTDPIPGSCLKCGWETDDLGPRLVYRNYQGACRECSPVRPVTQEEAYREFAAAGFTPDPGQQFMNSYTPMPGTCNFCGSPGKPLLSSIRSGQGACSGDCRPNRKKTEEGVRLLCIQREWVPDEPLNYQGQDQRIPGTCEKCGKRGPGPTYGSLRSGNGACASCGHSWDRTKPGILYVLWHPSLCVWQFGKTHFFDRRMSSHRRSGFDVDTAAKREEDGAWVDDVERALRSFARQPGFPQWKALGGEQFPGGGYTESFAGRSSKLGGWTPEGVEDGDTEAMLESLASLALRMLDLESDSTGAELGITKETGEKAEIATQQM